MTPRSAALIQGLSQCSLPIATRKKYFIRSMASLLQQDPGAELTEKQCAYLEQLRHHFRRQFPGPCDCTGCKAEIERMLCG